MRVLVYEENLIWASRLAQSLRGLGHEPVVHSTPVVQEAPLAIVNLGSPWFAELTPKLNELGVRVIGHAGHREKELLELGHAAGCQIVATNSEITYKIEALIARATDGA
jgi:hypothetical protein